MSNTIADLSKAVKRFLTSNTNLVNLVPGSPQNTDEMMAEIDDGIMDAANNARLFAERAHDFAANGGALGRAVLTFGAPINLDRVPIRRFFSGTGSTGINAGAVVGIESSLTDFPELTLSVDSSGDPVDVSNVVSVSFGDTVHAPLVESQEYTVINTRVNPDLTTTLTLGIAPGVALNVSGSSVLFNTGLIKRFKTVRAAYISDALTMYPIKVNELQTKTIELMKQEGMSAREYFPRDRYTTGNEHCLDQELTINGRFGTVVNAGDSVTIAIAGQTWMDPYTRPSDTDFLLQNGFDFMMWQTIVEMNFLLLKYVARQEGTIAPPTQARDAAWESLVLWDAHSIAGNIYYDL